MFNCVYTLLKNNKATNDSLAFKHKDVLTHNCTWTAFAQLFQICSVFTSWMTELSGHSVLKSISCSTGISCSCWYLHKLCDATSYEHKNTESAPTCHATPGCKHKCTLRMSTQTHTFNTSSEQVFNGWVIINHYSFLDHLTPGHLSRNVTLKLFCSHTHTPF